MGLVDKLSLEHPLTKIYIYDIYNVNSSSIRLIATLSFLHHQRYIHVTSLCSLDSRVLKAVEDKTCLLCKAL